MSTEADAAQVARIVRPRRAASAGGAGALRPRSKAARLHEQRIIIICKYRHAWRSSTKRNNNGPIWPRSRTVRRPPGVTWSSWCPPSSRRLPAREADAARIAARRHLVELVPSVLASPPSSGSGRRPGRTDRRPASPGGAGALRPRVVAQLGKRTPPGVTWWSWCAPSSRRCPGCPAAIPPIARAKAPSSSPRWFQRPAFALVLYAKTILICKPRICRLLDSRQNNAGQHVAARRCFVNPRSIRPRGSRPAPGARRLRL